MAEVSRLPLPIADNWDWQSNGACRSYPPELFFHPEGERGPSRRARINEAKSICGSCPVLLQCRSHALSVQEPYGIWGGLSEDERESILARGGRRGDVA
ncbi:transcriptional regulator WhiD [Actinomycetes bacterium]|nr:transcriptional regulator WhiD [Actinomycetes bacterium]